MHTRRLAVLLLGAWLMGSAFMSAVAIGNLQEADRILQSPTEPAAEYIKALGAGSTRTFLRYMASEQNRRFFKYWELVQLALGAGLAMTLVFSTQRGKIMIGFSLLLMLIVAVQHWLITPHLDLTGRAIDFMPPEALSLERERFWRLHNFYMWLEAGKAVIALGLTARLLVYRTRRRSKIRKDVNAVNNSDNSHING